MKFNINDKVKVKLTDAGKDEIRAQYEDLQLFCTSLRPYQEPVEDDQGYSEWQLWHLMSTFGELMCNGGDLYFDLEIIIPSNGEWIKCSDRMPLELSDEHISEVEVIVTDGTTVGTCECRRGYMPSPWVEWSNYGDIDADKITQWMPLPKPEAK